MLSTPPNEFTLLLGTREIWALNEIFLYMFKKVNMTYDYQTEWPVNFSTLFTILLDNKCWCGKLMAAQFWSCQ